MLLNLERFYCATTLVLNEEFHTIWLNEVSQKIENGYYLIDVGIDWSQDIFQVWISDELQYPEYLQVYLDAP